MSKHKGWIGLIASELNRCRDCTNDLDPRIPQETDESPGTLVSEATGRTGSWTKRPFLPPKLRYISNFFVCPSTFGSLFDCERNRRIRNE